MNFLNLYGLVVLAIRTVFGPIQIMKPFEIQLVTGNFSVCDWLSEMNVEASFSQFESVDEWMALADRLSEDLPDIIHTDPAVPDLLRAVKGMSPEQIKRLREAADEIREEKGKYK